MKLSLRRMLAIARKEAIQLRRDRRLLPLVFIAPVIQLTMLGYAASYDLKGVTLGVVDADHSELSRHLVQAIGEAQTFEIQTLPDAQALEKALVDGRLEGGVLLPEELTRRVEAGEPAEIALWLDGSNATRALAAKGELTAILTREAAPLAAPVLRDLGLEAAPSLDPPLAVVPKIRFNETLESRPFMIPGVLAMVLTIMTMILTAVALVRERERGTLSQIAVSPVRPSEWILGKLLPFIGVALVDVLLVTAVALFWFEVPLRGSFFTLLFLSGCYITSTLGAGLLISSVSGTQQQAMLTALLVILPVNLLSGIFYPIGNMPAGIRAFSYLMPLRYFGVALRTVFLKGGGVVVLWRETLAMLGIGALTLAFAILRTRRRLG